MSADNLWEKIKKGTKKVTKKTEKVATKATQDVKKTASTGVKGAQKAIGVAAKETEKAAETAAGEVKKTAETVGEFVQGLTSLGEKLDSWALPDGRLRFDEVAYLGSHNSHSNIEEGFVYSQQLWGLDKQLKRGVRHFLIDIWLGKARPNVGKLLLCHGSCEKESRGQRGGRTDHVSFRTYLEKIKRFLDTHPKEIISLELENYASGSDTLKAIWSVPGLSKYVLIPADYDPLKHDGKWPTLHELIKMGKRLIIFDTGDSSKYAFGTNDYLIRNMYGKLNVDQACEIRKKPAGSRLFQMNYFGTVTSPSPHHNTPEQLKKVLARCQSKNVVDKGKKPNFIALDNVHLGNAMKWVNELNASAAKRLK